ncbi:uncharacterized protein LOC107419368 [Ziziphus jujuba]|uniref:Uncharacterized protein LOC107419368 n=1 Tax=Ziziphus jujuba TaxID=326968 RepID=A0A6P6FQ00_ZIZJJ|nr:uncharacterized protein LOC107419368 [Ziziphus jujuba]
MDPPSPEEPEMIEVNIEWIGAPCSYQIRADAKVRQLKQKIKDEFIIGLPIRKQDLEYNGEWLEDDRTLEDYEIPSEATINLVRKIDLFVFKHGVDVDHTLLVNETITVAKLKEIIREYFGEPNITRLYDDLNNTFLDDNLSLSDYGITERSEVTYFVD